MIAKIHHSVAECRIPVRISSQRLESALESCEVRELLHTDRIEREINAEGFQRAGRTARRILAVALVEPRPLAEGPESKHPSGEHQSVVTNAKHALMSRQIGENPAECQCY